MKKHISNNCYLITGNDNDILLAGWYWTENCNKCQWVQCLSTEKIVPSLGWCINALGQKELNLLCRQPTSHLTGQGRHLPQLGAIGIIQVRWTSQACLGAVSGDGSCRPSCRLDCVKPTKLQHLKLSSKVFRGEKWTKNGCEIVCVCPLSVPSSVIFIEFH